METAIEEEEENLLKLKKSIFRSDGVIFPQIIFLDKEMIKPFTVLFSTPQGEQQVFSPFPLSSSLEEKINIPYYELADFFDENPSMELCDDIDFP